jgi:hypothetical protein
MKISRVKDRLKKPIQLHCMIESTLDVRVEVFTVPTMDDAKTFSSEFGCIHMCACNVERSAILDPVTVHCAGPMQAIIWPDASMHGPLLRARPQSECLYWSQSLKNIYCVHYVKEAFILPQSCRILAANSVYVISPSYALPAVRRSWWG